MKAERGVCNQVRTVRERLGLSQQELANAAGIARQTIGGIEAGQYAASAMVALRLAKALDCRVEDLFWLESGAQTLEAVAAEGMSAVAPCRVLLAQVGERWVAHPLTGEQAFRTEMVPADGLAQAAAGAETRTVTLLDEKETLRRTVLLAGCAPALSLWARSAERWYPGLRVHWTHANSTAALQRLARKEIHGAGIHFCDPSGGRQNRDFVRRLLPGEAVTLVNLGVWEEGFIVATGDPKGVRTITDLIRLDITLVNREEGSGSRLLLDSLLAQAGVPGAAVRGYERQVAGHLDVARAILTGQADVGLSASSVAATYGLGFVPLQAVRYDLALRTSSLTHEPVRQLLDTLHHRWVRSQLEALGGYDTTHTGEVVADLAPGS
jgi:putative molybdopterin biosynthesis protein